MVILHQNESSTFLFKSILFAETAKWRLQSRDRSTMCFIDKGSEGRKLQEKIQAVKRLVGDFTFNEIYK